jgi:hypothetical protein
MDSMWLPDLPVPEHAPNHSFQKSRTLDKLDPQQTGCVFKNLTSDTQTSFFEDFTGIPIVLKILALVYTR